MAKFSGITLFLSIFFCGAFAQTASTFSILFEYPAMNSFYRNQPLLAENYFDSPDAAHLDPPAYLLDNSISFKYHKREGYNHEVMFADNVNIVRFLGGWSALKNNTTIDEISKNDLAYRDGTGKIQYRWELLPARIDPVLAMGYQSPNIVLDNTPWCFPLTPYEPEGGDGYGQCNPPRDMNEWGQFITALCNELVRLYGYEKVNTWGFRLGTEAGGTTRFNGTPDEYRIFYKTTALAVKSVLPGAKVFPYNRAGKGHDNLKTLLSEAREQNFPYTASPVSTYSIATLDSNNALVTNTVNPDYVASGAATAMWYEMDAISAPSTLSREVHEYGWFLVNELGDRDNAPGARGAAGNFHYIMDLRKYRLDRLFHWSVIDPPDDSQKNILNSQGFIYSVWDYCNDATRVVELNNTLKLTKQSSQLYKSVGFFKPAGKSYIMVSGFNMNRNQRKKNEISVYVPTSVYNSTSFKVSYTTLNDSTDHYRMLRNDLSDKGVLYAQYENDSNYIAQYNTMSAKAKYWLQTDNDKYVQRIKENLTLKPYKYKVQITADGIILTFPLNTPELFVIALEQDTSSGTDLINERINGLSVFPNVVTDRLTINTTLAENAEIFDVTGKMMQRFDLTATNEISLGHFKKGVYLMKVRHNGMINTEKIIKK